MAKFTYVIIIMIITSTLFAQISVQGIHTGDNQNQIDPTSEVIFYLDTIPSNLNLTFNITEEPFSGVDAVDSVFINNYLVGIFDYDGLIEFAIDTSILISGELGTDKFNILRIVPGIVASNGTFDDFISVDIIVENAINGFHVGDNQNQIDPTSEVIFYLDTIPSNLNLTFNITEEPFSGVDAVDSVFINNYLVGIFDYDGLIEFSIDTSILISGELGTDKFNTLRIVPGIVASNGTFDDFILYDIELTSKSTSIKNKMNIIPEKFIFSQNFPNPFNPSTTINLFLFKDEYIDLKIFNSQGQLIFNLFQGHLNTGDYRFKWYGNNNELQPVSSGIYFYQISTKYKIITRKMLLLR